MSEGKIRPEDLEPDIGPFEYYMDCFRELSTCRNNGMSLGPIPVTAILDYFKAIDGEDFENFIYIMRLLDDTLLKHMAEKSKAKGKNATGNSSSPNTNSNGRKGR